MPDTLKFDPKTHQVIGPAGALPVAASDQQAARFLMLLEGECLESNITAVAQHYGFSRPRYYQLLQDYKAGGLPALEPQKTGPKSNYRRTDQAVRQVLRYRFLDPNAPPPKSSPKNCAKPISGSACAASTASSPITACKKKLYALNPKNAPPPLPIQRAGKRIRLGPADARSVDREVRQLLADKVSGNLLGLWLLVPEHLRLGTWDLLRTWSAEPAQDALG